MWQGDRRSGHGEKHAKPFLWLGTVT